MTNPTATVGLWRTLTSIYVTVAGCFNVGAISVGRTIGARFASLFYGNVKRAATLNDAGLPERAVHHFVASTLCDLAGLLKDLVWSLPKVLVLLAAVTLICFVALPAIFVVLLAIDCVSIPLQFAYHGVRYLTTKKA